MKTIISAAALILVAAWIAPVSSQDKAQPKPDIRGLIQKVNPLKPGGEALASILVDNPKKDTAYDKASVTITKKTKLLRIGAADDRAANIADLKVGTKVEVTFVGPVAESYPVQARAGEVRIIVEAPKEK